VHKWGGNFLKPKLLFEEIKCLHAFMKKRTLILVVYAESKPSASYAQRLGGK
jgi:hypothetical protein